MTNRLQQQTSPYLLQHAGNPVDWQPWDDQALNQAINEDKPILLSIGYSACHWCHVMEAESFENPQIAEVMNDNFICIKVDREERPDLDKIYQLAHQMLTQRPGGWPLTVALTPNGHAPFFAGTYFPPESRHNMPGFGDLLKKIALHYTDNQSQLSDYHVSFEKALNKLNPVPDETPVPNPEIALESALSTLQQQYDSTFGGFGDAPKFPHPSQLELLLLGATSKDPKHSEVCSEMAVTTLSNMVNGGLYDQIGGGFFRYSVDRKWQIPHFEKMGYDNAQLLCIYSSAYQLFNNHRYGEALQGTANWVIRELQTDSGGYASTLDADSRGKKGSDDEGSYEEGKYYVWNETDLRAILSEDQYMVLENYFGLYGEENFEGGWHFNINPETDHELLANSPELKKSVEDSIKLLHDFRQEREMPALDDKILSGWNGLMIKGMACAGKTLEQQPFIDSAQRAADFVRNNMWQGNRLLATCSNGKARLNGYLDDYAFMLDGLLELLEAKWRTVDLEFAVSLCNSMLDRFEDTENGGFFFTSHDHEELLYRSKAGADDAIPSGNAVAIRGLLKLGTILGDSGYLDSAHRALDIFARELNTQSSVNASMTAALQLLRPEHTTIIIRGDEPEISEWAKLCHAGFRPMVSCYTLDKNQKALPAGLAVRKALPDTVAYACNGTRCLPPIIDVENLTEYLHSL